MNLLPSDLLAFERAIQLAQQAELLGNLPIGAVITCQDEIIAEGQNAVWVPHFNANRHAEIEALRAVPQELWRHARQMTLVTTLEPCLMCTGAILLHRIGRVLYGSADPYGGALSTLDCLPPFFEAASRQVDWLGPALPDQCDPLFARVMQLVERRDGLLL